MPLKRNQMTEFMDDVRRGLCAEFTIVTPPSMLGGLLFGKLDRESFEQNMQVVGEFIQTIETVTDENQVPVCLTCDYRFRKNNKRPWAFIIVKAMVKANEKHPKGDFRRAMVMGKCASCCKKLNFDMKAIECLVLSMLEDDFGLMRGPLS